MNESRPFYTIYNTFFSKLPLKEIVRILPGLKSFWTRHVTGGLIASSFTINHISSYNADSIENNGPTGRFHRIPTLARPRFTRLNDMDEKKTSRSKIGKSETRVKVICYSVSLAYSPLVNQGQHLIIALPNYI